MPRGSRMRWSASCTTRLRDPILEVIGSGSWRCEGRRDGRRAFSGKHVRMPGIRDGFDTLAVKSIKPAPAS